MLKVQQEHRLIRLSRSGRLLDWLGPAIRGGLGRYMKHQVCRLPLPEKDERKYCKGCPHMSTCGYGQTLEPDPPEGARVFAGQEESARPLVVAPHYPVPDKAKVGDAFPICLTFIGSSAGGYAPEIWDMLDEVGRQRGLGRQGITFEVVSEREHPTTIENRPVDLPLSLDALAGTVRRLGVQLTSPLFLISKIDGRRRLNLTPSFSELFRATLRALGAMHRLYDSPLPADFAGLKEAAEKIETVDARYELFTQKHHSSRQNRFSRFRGIVGHAEFANVPLSLARWIVWGGRVHVGVNRVCGAGGWDVGWSDFDGVGPVPKNRWHCFD